MRGKSKLFDKLVEVEQTTQGQGRSSLLHGRRNKALVYRYYFYTTHTQLRYEAILDRLSSEFYIAPFTIQERIDEQFSLLTEIRGEKPTVKDLKLLYPHLNWTISGDVV